MSQLVTPPTREYNGLTGAELAEMLVAELERVLALDGRFTHALVYHNLHVEGEFRVSSYPAEPPQQIVEVDIEVGQMPQEGEEVAIPALVDVVVPAPDIIREDLRARATEKRKK